ncbi:cullin [Obelidium mucronatum]|nr:cullin [Obelidium mucronatum]
MQTPNVKSIWDMGLDLFRARLLGECVNGIENDGARFKTRIVDAVLQTIDAERNGQQVPIDLLKSIIQMFLDLGIYMTVFESRFLATSESFYVSEGNRWINDIEDGSLSGVAVGLYLKHVEKRIEEEQVRCGGVSNGGSGYLSTATRKGIISIAESVLVEKHVLILLQRGFDNLIQDNQTDDLGRMYAVFNRVHLGLQEMRKYFGNYVVKVGLSIVNDVARDPTMVPDLLAFRKKMDNLSMSSFCGNKEFVQAIRESFEKFINKRHNKPAELIAKHIDALMRSGKGSSEDETEEVLDQCLALFRFIHGKDVFEAFYKKDLAKRLLLGKSSSVDSEKSMLTKLKVECGAGFTSKLESMFKDIETSKDIVSSFRQSKRLRDQIGSIDVYVNFLTAGMWPTYPMAPLTIPAELERCQNIFKEFYMSKHSGRRLTWQNQLGHCVLKATFKKATKELSVSLFQAVILLLFNESSTLTYKEIAQLTNMEAKELDRTLQSLACGKTRVINKIPKGRDVLPTDSFEFNESFENPLFRIKINSIQLKETVEENKDTTEKVFADRQYQVDAAIVRIMKTRKKLTHTLLIAELFEQLKFPIKAQDLKKRIESLIDREYLEREKSDSTTYIYLA